MEKKELGKITSLVVGYGGYDDAMIGISIGLGGDHWGCADWRGTWAHRPEYAEWAEETQIKHWGEAMKWLRDLMDDAKVKSSNRLVGVPVEVTFVANKLYSWRILKEVL